MRRRRLQPAALIAVLVAVAISVWQQRDDRPHAPTPTPASTIASSERAQLDATLALIERGGPFPYKKDGTVFANREGRLPAKPRGYYREFTVPTPGAKNRGARRIVRGEGGETYYTRDHYRTFVRLRSAQAEPAP